MPEDDVRESILQSILVETKANQAFPETHSFRMSHEAQRHEIDEMRRDGLVQIESERYVPTLEGIHTLGSEEARAVLDAAQNLLAVLQNHYRRSPAAPVSARELADEASLELWVAGTALEVLLSLGIRSSSSRDASTGFARNVSITESVLDFTRSDIAPPDVAISISGSGTAEITPHDARPVLKEVEIRGYRPFRDFRAELGKLTVIAGANASGKSSLFDFFRFITRAVSAPLPPEIDEQWGGARLFHAGGPERISFALVQDFGEKLPLRYEVEILGPVGTPYVVSERLTTTGPLWPTEQEAFVFLDFMSGKGVVRDPRERKLVRPEWALKTNELALRRALDPTLATLSRVQSYLSSWRFYSGFDVSPKAQIRRPVPTDPDPVLAEDGSNLSALLMSMSTTSAGPWDELESYVRSAVPGFRSLTVEARGGPGTIIGVWREEGVRDKLTLADLSDGTLRFLCLAALCLSPRQPPLVCIDEPELGLHPRVFPVLAAMLRVASSRTQLLVSTHSPYFLSQFPLEDIAVMRKDDGQSVFLRPNSSLALRDAVSKIGSEAIARLHISDEMENLP